jgi:hypothetical protein
MNTSILCRTGSGYWESVVWIGKNIPSSFVFDLFGLQLAQFCVKTYEACGKNWARVQVPSLFLVPVGINLVPSSTGIQV